MNKQTDVETQKPNALKPTPIQQKSNGGPEEDVVQCLTNSRHSSCRLLKCHKHRAQHVITNVADTLQSRIAESFNCEGAVASGWVVLGVTLN